jgi:hypothetical protein
MFARVEQEKSGAERPLDQHELWMHTLYIVKLY